LTLNRALVSGGVATLDVPRQLLITADANDSARTLTITGTDRYGTVSTVTTAVPNATTKIVTGVTSRARGNRRAGPGRKRVVGILPGGPGRE